MSVAILIGPLASPKLLAQWHQYSDQAMTTRIELEFWAPEVSQAKALAGAVFTEFQRIEQLMSSYIAESALSQLNRRAASSAQPVGMELFDLIALSLRISDMTQGAFDITYGSLGKYYDFRERTSPDEQQIAAYAGKITYRDVLLKPQERTIRFRHPGLSIDLGGIAKGYAVDRAYSLLKAAGIESGRISAGGDMRLLGDKQGKPWIVGVIDPRAKHKNAVLLPLENTAISTSGDYERFFINDQGERVHHIVSPRTGRSARGVQSVSIIGPDATTTDALSTSVFVLGVERGLGLINTLDGIEAIIIDQARKLHYSAGLLDPKADSALSQ